MQKDYTFIQKLVNEHKKDEKNWLLAWLSDTYVLWKISIWMVIYMKGIYLEFFESTRTITVINIGKYI